MDTPGAIKTVMASMTPKGWMLLLGAALLALAETSWGQKPSNWPVNWRVYRMADGLPESACISVALAPQGKVLARHLKSGSVSELDGYTVNVIPSPGPGTGRVYQSPGGQLWAVVAEGLQEFKDGQWVLHPVPEIAAEFRARLPRAIDPIRCARPGRALSFSCCPTACCNSMPKTPTRPHTEVLLTAAQTRLERFSSMTLARDGGLVDCRRAWTAQIPGARSQSEARAPSGTITFHPSRSRFTISRSRTKRKGASLLLWLKPRGTTRSCWSISTASTGLPRPSPSKRPGMPGAAWIKTCWASDH